MKFLAAIITAMAASAAALGSQACVYFIIDEPAMPKSLIEK